MLFFVHHVDRPNSLELRKATRDAHLAYMKAFPAVVAGPTLDEVTGDMDGSVIILDLPDIADARAFVANDPYVKAGLFERSLIKPWKQVIPPVSR